MSNPDERIKRDIINQLCWDSRVDASRIGVTVDRGTVSLTGKVQSLSARQTAELDTESIAGVVAVRNELQIEPGAEDDVPNDDDLAETISTLLEWSQDVDASNIEVTVDDGWVTLRGTVDALWLTRRVEDLATNIAGVQGIINDLAVVPTKDIHDQSIAEVITEKIVRDPAVEMNGIHVKVERGHVTLTGAVASWGAKRAAYEAALHTVGVNDIDDAVDVVPES